LPLCTQDPIVTQPSTGEAAEKGFALFEALAEFAKPRQHRGAQGIPPAAGQVAGCLFLVSSFGQAKEEKGEQKKAPSLFHKRPEANSTPPLFTLRA
jgi:hypothetical protein